MKKTRNNRVTKAACGAGADTRHDAYQRLRALLGTEADARDVPRRRERPPNKRRDRKSVV